MVWRVGIKPASPPCACAHVEVKKKLTTLPIYQCPATGNANMPPTELPVTVEWSFMDAPV